MEQAVLQDQLVAEDEAEVAGERQQECVAGEDVGPLGARSQKRPLADRIGQGDDTEQVDASTRRGLASG